MSVTELPSLLEDAIDETLYKMEELRAIANSLIDDSVKVNAGEKVLLWYDDNPGSIPLLHELKNRCLAKGVEVLLLKRNLAEDAEKFSNLPVNGTADVLGQDTYFDKQGDLVEKADAIIFVRGALNPRSEANKSREFNIAEGV